MVVRVLLGLLATTVGLLLVVLVGSVSAQTWDWGAGLVVAACVLGGAALGCATMRVP